MDFVYVSSCACGRRSFEGRGKSRVFQLQCRHVCCNDCVANKVCPVEGCTTKVLKKYTVDISFDYSSCQLSREKLSNINFFMNNPSVTLEDFLEEVRDAQYQHRSIDWELYKLPTKDNTPFERDLRSEMYEVGAERVKLSGFNFGLIENAHNFFDLRCWNAEQNMESIRKLLVRRIYGMSEEKLKAILDKYTETVNCLRSLLENIHYNRSIDETTYVQPMYIMLLRSLRTDLGLDKDFDVTDVTGKNLSSKLFKVNMKKGKAMPMRLVGHGDVLAEHQENKQRCITELKAAFGGLYRSTAFPEKNQLGGELICLHTHGQETEWEPDIDKAIESVKVNVKTPMVGLLCDMMVISAMFAVVIPESDKNGRPMPVGRRGYFMCNRVHKVEHFILLLLLNFVDGLTNEDISFAFKGDLLTIDKRTYQEYALPGPALSLDLNREIVDCSSGRGKRRSKDQGGRDGGKNKRKGAHSSPHRGSGGHSAGSSVSSEQSKKEGGSVTAKPVKTKRAAPADASEPSAAPKGNKRDDPDKQHQQSRVLPSATIASSRTKREASSNKQQPQQQKKNTGADGKQRVSYPEPMVKSASVFTIYDDRAEEKERANELLRKWVALSDGRLPLCAETLSKHARIPSVQAWQYDINLADCKMSGSASGEVPFKRQALLPRDTNTPTEWGERK